MDQGEPYNSVVDPLSLDHLDKNGFLDFTERFDVRIHGIESSPKLQMRLRGTREAIKQAAEYLYARQKANKFSPESLDAADSCKCLGCACCSVNSRQSRVVTVPSTTETLRNHSFVYRSSETWTSAPLSHTKAIF